MKGKKETRVEAADCITWIVIAGASVLFMRILWGLANPKPNRLDDDLDEWDFIAMIDDMEHGDN